MKNPFKKKTGDTTGISICANGLKERQVRELAGVLIKILQTSAGDIVKQTAINALSNASKSEVSNVNVSNVTIEQSKE